MIGLLIIAGGLQPVFAQYVVAENPIFEQDFAFPRLYIRSPETLVENELHITTSYSYEDFKTLWGVRFDDFEELQDPLSGENHVDFTYERFQADIMYGVTNRLVVGGSIPWRRVSFRRRWKGSEHVEPGELKDSTEGIGDVTMYAQYRILKELQPIIPFSLTIEGNLKLDTGDDRRIAVAGTRIGTGETSYQLSTTLSKEVYEGSMSLGFTYDTEGKSELGFSIDKTSYTVSAQIAQNIYKGSISLGAAYSLEENPEPDSDLYDTIYTISTQISQNIYKGVTFLNFKYKWSERKIEADFLEYSIGWGNFITYNMAVSGQFYGKSFMNWEPDYESVEVDSEPEILYASVNLHFRMRNNLTGMLGLSYPLNDDFVRTTLTPYIRISYEK